MVENYVFYHFYCSDLHTRSVLWSIKVGLIWISLVSVAFCLFQCCPDRDVKTCLKNGCNVFLGQDNHGICLTSSMDCHYCGSYSVIRNTLAKNGLNKGKMHKLIWFNVVRQTVKFFYFMKSNQFLGFLLYILLVSVAVFFYNSVIPDILSFFTCINRSN